MTDLALPASNAIAHLGPELESAEGYARESRAANTRRAYASDLARFGGWCTSKGLPALPAAPAAVALYLAHLADVRRRLGVAQRGKAPFAVPALRTAVEAPVGLLVLRDRALLLLGFAGGRRRSELVALDVVDLAFGDDGISMTVRRSKTNQKGATEKYGIPFGSAPESCPVGAVRAWLEAARISEGALFRTVSRHGRVSAARLSDRAVAEVVKRGATLAGLDPATYSGHSLRAGLATAAAAAGKAEGDIMQTGHRSDRMVRRYIRDVGLFRDNAAAGLL